MDSSRIHLLHGRQPIFTFNTKELEAAIPNLSSQTLPYLRAVVQESIRLGYGAPGQVCHIAPDEAMVVAGQTTMAIPPGTPTCMTVYLIHYIESIFPLSYTFHPERWIENPRLDKHLFAFGKGSRGCAGSIFMRS
jgi:cytochrome P450